MSRRPLIVVLLTIVSVLAVAGRAHAAPGDLPRLTGAVPQNVIRDWYDDHSVSGDGHLSWSDQGAGTPYINTSGIASEREPQSIRFDATLHVGAPGGLEICGYPSGTPGWMAAYQAAPGNLTTGTCATPPGTPQIGWFRYVYGRHSAANLYNRWHFMDLERYALVPMPADQGGPAAGAPTVWDNHWGTCLNLLDPDPGCTTSIAAGGLDVGVAAGADKATQPHEVDSPLIAIPADLQPLLPAGRYQVVDLVNPYGAIRESGGVYGSISCVTINLAFGIPEPYVLAVSVAEANPATCYAPAGLDPAIGGPGVGFDPMAGADAVPACTLPYANPGDTSHCWPASGAPGSETYPAPHDGDHIAAHTLSTGDPMNLASVAVPQGTPASAVYVASGGPPTTPAAPPKVPHPRPGPQPGDPPDVETASDTRKAVSVAKSRTRTALRHAFGKGLKRLRVSCKLRSKGASTCTVSWRKRGWRYSGHVYLRLKTLKGRERWQYRVDVTRRKGHQHKRIKRAYRTGGTLS